MVGLEAQDRRIVIPDDMVDNRIRVGGSRKYLVLILLASKRYMIVSFIETTDLTPKQYTNRINLSYLFPNKPN